MAPVRHGHRVGGRKSPTYVSWEAMIARCTYPTHPRYEDYGGRGVQVDKRWTGPDGFAHFLEDLGARPVGKTLDRRDVNGHYTPSNCQWATLQWQRWNRRDMAERTPPAPDEYRLDPLYEPASPAAEREALPF